MFSTIQNKKIKNQSGNFTPGVIVLGLIIVGSLAFFGNYWYKIAKNSTDSDGKENVKNVLSENTPQQPPAPPEVSDEDKSERPNVELFVMSHCPYGTQIEKGMIPVVQALGDTIDFELKFVDYAMHDKVELDEQLTQYCIQKDNPNEFLSYLECFLEDGDSPTCVSEVGLSADQLAACVEQTDQEYAVTASYEDQSTWVSGRFPPFNVHAEENEEYGVEGSPTLVVNGVQAQAPSRDSSSLLATVCEYFTETPEDCEISLNSEVPGPGFGYDTTGSNSSASCN